MYVAVVNNVTNIVENMIVADINDPPFPGYYFVEIHENQTVNIGWLWNGVNFIDPNL